MWQSAIMSTLLWPFGICFTNNSTNSPYVGDLLSIAFINAVVFITIAYFWKDCGLSLVWSSRSYSNIYFNLLFAVWVPTSSNEFHWGWKCLKVLEKENTTVSVWNRKVSLSLSYKNSMLLKCFDLLLRLWHSHPF